MFIRYFVALCAVALCVVAINGELDAAPSGAVGIEERANPVRTLLCIIPFDLFESARYWKINLALNSHKAKKVSFSFFPTFSKRELCNGDNFQTKDFDEFRCFWGSINIALNYQCTGNIFLKNNNNNNYNKNDNISRHSFYKCRSIYKLKTSSIKCIHYWHF